MTNYKSEWIKLGEQLLQGKKIKEITLNGKLYKFNEKQIDFISDLSGKNNKFVLFSGGRGAGKSLALCIKMILFCKCFPGNRILLGRKNISDIEKTTLQDLFKLLPSSWYEHRVKDGLINFNNGSQIIMFGLDAMQSGNMLDIKKAQQKTKSLNIGGFFIDQLEEIEYEVFQALNDTMRMVAPEVSKFLQRATDEEKLIVQAMSSQELFEKHGLVDYPRQGNMTCNPANFWGYHYFKLNEQMTEEGHWTAKTRNDSRLIEVSMLDNATNLPDDFVKDRMNRDESYVRRFVHGEWSTDLLTKGAVFAKEYIRFLETFRKLPEAIEEGCEIYEQPKPNLEYRMGIDPSEGITDPSSISIVSSDGRKVAKFNGKIPITGLADKVKFLYYKYRKPLIVPESNSAGQALIREIRDLKVYRRKVMDEKYDKETEKLGFRMASDSKAQLIQHFQQLLRANRVKIYDPKTTEEMKTFLWSDEASQSGAGAARGFHDDDIMSTMLAYWEHNPTKSDAIRITQVMKPVIRKRFQYN